jgi:two-component system chemotaxis response regulator CheB
MFAFGSSLAGTGLIMLFCWNNPPVLRANLVGELVKILIVEDDPTSTLILERSLRKAGYETLSATDGVHALEILKEQPCDAIVSDWMMPRMDGIELIHRLRSTVQPLPVFLIVTSLSLPEARTHALQAGADDYLAKPFAVPEVLERLANCLARRQQPEPLPSSFRRTPSLFPMDPPPAFTALGITASTGGPEAVREVVRGIGAFKESAIFLVLHGPAWMLETFASRLQRETNMPVRLAEDAMPVEPGKIYLAPGDWHMTIAAGPVIQLNKEAPENYMRPAADPLFRSLASVFQGNAIAVILTGMGRDGALGAAEIVAHSGTVLAQDPRTAVAPSMPQTAINAGVVTQVLPLQEISAEILRKIGRISDFDSNPS